MEDFQIYLHEFPFIIQKAYEFTDKYDTPDTFSASSLTLEDAEKIFEKLKVNGASAGSRGNRISIRYINGLGIHLHIYVRLDGDEEVFYIQTYPTKRLKRLNSSAWFKHSDHQLWELIESIKLKREEDAKVKQPV